MRREMFIKVVKKPAERPPAHLVELLQVVERHARREEIRDRTLQRLRAHVASKRAGWASSGSSPQPAARRRA